MGAGSAARFEAQTAQVADLLERAARDQGIPVSRVDARTVEVSADRAGDLGKEFIEEARRRIVLYWQATAPITHDWSISLRPTRGGAPILSDGQVVQVDHTHPAQGVYPTSRWTPGEVVRDEYIIPPTSGQSLDGFLVIVYRALPEGGFVNAAEISLPLP